MFGEQRVSIVLNSSYTMLTVKELTLNVRAADGLHFSWLFKVIPVSRGTWACPRHSLLSAGIGQNHKVRQHQPA